jgi:hypothetical protein
MLSSYITQKANIMSPEEKEILLDKTLDYLIRNQEESLKVLQEHHRALDIAQQCMKELLKANKLLANRILDLEKAQNDLFVPTVN